MRGATCFGFFSICIFCEFIVSSGFIFQLYISYNAIEIDRPYKPNFYNELIINAHNIIYTSVMQLFVFNSSQENNILSKT